MVLLIVVVHGIRRRILGLVLIGWLSIRTGYVARGITVKCLGWADLGLIWHKDNKDDNDDLEKELKKSLGKNSKLDKAVEKKLDEKRDPAHKKGDKK
jgi:hypothetical protein